MWLGSLFSRGMVDRPGLQQEYKQNAGATGVMEMIEKLVHEACGLRDCVFGPGRKCISCVGGHDRCQRSTGRDPWGAGCICVVVPSAWS